MCTAIELLLLLCYTMCTATELQLLLLCYTMCTAIELLLLLCYIHTYSRLTMTVASSIDRFDRYGPYIPP